jgi:hypothetical protein
MAKKSLAEAAAGVAAKVHSIKKPLIVDSVETLDPKSNAPQHLFRIVSAEDPNGPAYVVALNARGEAVDAERPAASAFDRTVLGISHVSPAAPVTINPDTNVFTLNPDDTLTETITVTIPKNTSTAQADVYFLADTTGSMETILSAVQAGANTVLSALNGLGVDMMFGVGNYKDFASGDPYAFQHQVSPTNAAATITAAINSWSASGGSDLPEANLFALDSLAVAPGGTIGWRAGSARIIVWFGDAPGHDPICTAVSGAPAAITEASATARLVAEQIAVLAISTAVPGLDANPATGANDYGACGAPGGLAGQATRIANATGGAFVTGINASNIVNTIISLVSSAVSGLANVKLVPSASISPFVVSITPAGGYGPLAGDRDHTLTFEVTFRGVPCKPEPQVITGTIDVIADGRVVASKRVQITVPACAFVYSVKFVCGVQSECDCECQPVQPGTYATEINIHNYSLNDVDLVKRFIPLVLAGAATGREPRVTKVRAEERVKLPRQTATMDDCCRIVERLFGAESASMPVTIGILEITASADIAVTAVYTTSGLKSGGVSIDVEQIAGRRR